MKEQLQDTNETNCSPLDARKLQPSTSLTSLLKNKGVMASLSIINKTHTQGGKWQTKRHTNSLTQNKREITHSNVQSNTLTQ